MDKFKVGILFVLLSTVLVSADESVSWNIVEPGFGHSLKVGDTATVSFRLTLESGELIQETTDKSPLTFEVGADGIIPGLSEGVLAMKRGETRQVKIPSSLAYGAQGKGPIPPNATLLFEVKLLDYSAPSLSDKFLDEKFLAARHANKISKPAIFEYLIRDFFTKPWRYPEGYRKIWGASLRVTLIALILFTLSVVGRRRGFWL